jgi:glycosyltransferase involved in cell wall biosynthesis
VTLRVAQAGIRGVPANFGGSETAVEEIGGRLAAEGVEVVVYCRRHKSPFPNGIYKGMRRVVLPSIPTFNFDTISHSTLASLHAVLRDSADVVHFHGMGNALCLPIFLGSRKKTVITIDGPDWERPKWGPVARRALRLSATLAVRWADHLIIDNHPSIDYFRRAFGLADEDFTYIPYGADRERPKTTEYVRSLGLEPGRYVLFVGALVPDKGPDMLLDAYRDVKTNLPLVVVGDSPFHAEYRAQLHEAAARDPRVRMLGYVYDDRYRELLAHAYAYAHPLRSDGTSPALLQALGYATCVVINSLPEALSAVGDGALPFALNDAADLAKKLQLVIDDPALAAEYRKKALARAVAEYDWDRVAEQHREIYERLGRGGSSRVG